MGDKRAFTRCATPYIRAGAEWLESLPSHPAPKPAAELHDDVTPGPAPADEIKRQLPDRGNPD